MTLDLFIKRSLHREDQLFPKVYSFNYHISTYIDPSYLDDDIRAIFFKIKDVSRVKLKLSDYLVTKFGLDDLGYFDFEEPRLRLALIDKKILFKLLMFAGAVYYSDLISKVIKKDDLGMMKKGIGEEVYFFATKRAALVKALAPKISFEGEPTSEAIFEAGKHILEICLSHESGKLLKRLALKFPKHLHWNFGRNVEEAEKTRAWQYLQRLLFKEIEPGVKSCFV